MKVFIYTVIGIVAVSIIAGFFIVGSPKEERLRRFDERRVSDLQFLQSEIIYYWQNKEKLPEKITDIEDNIRGIRIPLDPETGAAYEYEIKGPLSFALCATFSRSSEENLNAFRSQKLIYPAPYQGGDNWTHPPGRTCFERTIDKDFYKSRGPEIPLKVN
jgi:hypothetical protein